jgi:hypothetical protein
MDPYRFGFVMEQTLGHATYHRRLAQFLAGDPTVRATWLAIPPWEDDCWARMPVVGRNATLSLNLRARPLATRAGRLEIRRPVLPHPVHGDVQPRPAEAASRGHLAECRPAQDGHGGLRLCATEALSWPQRSAVT